MHSQGGRLRFVETLNEISNSFISIKEENAEEGILQALETVCGYSQVGRGYLFQFSNDMEYMELAYEWCAPGVKAHKGAMERFAVRELPEFMESLSRNEVIKVNASELPVTEDTRVMREILQLLSIKSFVNIPVFVSDRLTGYIGFDATEEEKVWTDENIYAFTFVGQTVGNLLARLRAERQLKSAVATKDKFFSILAHDLRNPFIGIVEGTKILQEELIESGDPFLSKISGGIYRSARRVQQLLEELLALSRAADGLFPFQPEVLDLAGPAAETLELVHWNCVRKEISIRSEIPPRITVYADRDMLLTVLRNLVSNAVKYTSAGGTVLLSAAGCPGGTEISISDTGCGMPPEKVSRLFRIGEPEISTPGSDGEKGTGLGLLLSHEFVQRHGGEVRVSSRPGQGSCFTVFFPEYYGNG